eukprot:6344045-Pyramimonas_sp.AAC.1
MTYLYSGHPVPLELNDIPFAFPPKGSEPEDAQGRARSPGKVRPLSLRRTDAMIMASAANFQIRQVAQERAHEAQQGFIPG